MRSNDLVLVHMRGTFSDVLAALETQRGVEKTRMFGSTGLKVARKVFAMEVKSRLVVKLRPARAEALVSAGEAIPFDPGHGRTMKAWISLSSEAGPDSVDMAREAMATVGAEAR